MMDWLNTVHRGRKAVEFTPGDDVRVYYRIKEQGKERVAFFEGVVIRVRGFGPSRTFTVRRITHGEGVERVFPVEAPVIDRIDVLRHGKNKRSRLYFLRHVVKKTRLATVEGPTGSGGPADAAEGSAQGADAASDTPKDAVVAAEPSSGGKAAS